MTLTPIYASVITHYHTIAFFYGLYYFYCSTEYPWVLTLYGYISAFVKLYSFNTAKIVKILWIITPMIVRHASYYRNLIILLLSGNESNSFYRMVITQSKIFHIEMYYYDLLSP